MAEKKRKKDIDGRLEAIAAAEIKASVTYDNTTLAKTRQDALDYIEGRMKDWPAEEGRSSVVDMTTLDTISWILPNLMRLFLASENMVLAEAKKEEGEQSAKQATAQLNYDFLISNEGYAILYDTTWLSLLHGDGIVKHWWDDTPTVKTSFHSQLTEEQLEHLLQPEEQGETEDGEELETVEVLALEETIYTLEPGDEGYVDPNTDPAAMSGMPGGIEGQMPPSAPAEPGDAAQGSPPLDVPSGMEIAPVASQGPANALPMEEETRQTQKGEPLGPNQHVYYDVKIKRTCRYGRLRWSCVAPENFVINRGATSLSKARVVGDREQMTRSELIEMGFDYDKVMSLNAQSDDSAEQVSRDEGSTAESSDQPVDNPMMETAWLYELYLKVDVDDDGIAETVQIHFCDNGTMGALLDWEVWEDEEVYSQVPCYRFPFRWNSNSLFTRTKDIAEIKTVLQRSTLDSLYASVNPQKVVTGRVINPDELNNPSFGGSILMDDGGSIQNLEIPFVGDKVIGVIEYFDNQVERRTGVSRTTTALDPEALQNTTATASQLAHDASYAQIELIARNMAELGWKHAFACALKLIIRHQRRKETIRLSNGQYMDVDPRHWNAEMDIAINTGLGTGSRDRDIAMVSSIQTDQVAFAQILREAKLAGRALEMVPKIATSLRKKAEAAGVKNVDQFFPEISPQDLQEAAKAIQEANKQQPLEVQIEQMRMQLQMQLDQSQTQLKAQEMQLKAEADARKEQAQMEADLIVKEKELQRDMMLAEQQQAFEREKLLVEVQQKALDRQQQLRIETLKIEAKARADAMAMRQQKEMADADRNQTGAIELSKLDAGERDSVRRSEVAKNRPNGKSGRAPS